MTSNRPPTRRPKKRAQDESSAATHEATGAPENISGDLDADASADQVAAGTYGASKTARFRTQYHHVCPKCHGRFVRMHRTFADRLLSMFNPVRRYGCTNTLCRYEPSCGRTPRSRNDPSSRLQASPARRSRARS
jgi:hypothetical protein